MKKFDLRYFTVLSCLIFTIALLLLNSIKLYQTNTNNRTNITARNSAVQIEVDVNVSILGLPSSNDMSITGSGNIIGRKNNIVYVITAAHVCEPSIAIDTELPEIMLRRRVNDSAGNTYEIKTLTYDELSDICIMKYETEDVLPGWVEISRHPATLDENVYSYCSPMGFYSPTSILKYQGIYSGNVIHIDFDENRMLSVYTLPAVGGASGGGILNSDNEIVGIIHSAIESFHHITFSSTHGDVLRLIEKAEEMEGWKITER